MCLTQQPPPVTGCVKVELHSAFAPGLREVAAARSHTLLFLARWVTPLWVAGSPVAFLVATRQWPPVRCAAVLDFLQGAVPREGRQMVSSGGLLPGGTALDTFLEQCVERLSHERTKGHWQSPIFAPESYSGTPRQPTPRLMGHVPMRQSPVPSQGVVRPGWGGGLSVHSRRHRRITQTVQ